MRILITQSVPLNGGDAAILLGIARILRRALTPDCRIVVFGSQPEASARQYPEFDFRAPIFEPLVARGGAFRSLRGRLWRWRLGRAVESCRLGRIGAARRQVGARRRPDLEEYWRADLIVATGGTYLVENYRLAPRVLDLNLSLAVGAPLVLFTQSLGPFREPKNRAALRPIFAQAARILLRDARSRSHIEELDIETPHVSVSADAAFALADPRVLLRARTRVFPDNRRLRIAVSVRNWRHFETLEPTLGMSRYKEALGALVTELVRRWSAEVTFVSTCQGNDAYWTDDSKLAQELAAGLRPDVRAQVQVDEQFHRPEELIELLSHQDVVVATRMHMAILSLVAGTPVFPIAYEFKTRELLSRLGGERWVQDIETVAPAPMIAAFHDFMAGLDGHRAALFEGVERERRLALDSGRWAAEALGLRSGAIS